MNKQIEWFKDNKEFLNVRKISEVTGIPQRTLSAFLSESDSRGLPDKWVKPLTAWIKKFRS